jgi:predicted phage terminase large subunit-like protein
MSVERLEKARKRQGERRFARKYLNDATDEGGKLLKADLLHFVSHTQVPWTKLTYFGGVDPATGETEVAEPDEYAIAWGGRTPDGVVYLLGTMGSPNWNIADGTYQLQKLHNEKGLMRVAVESVSFSVAAKQDIWRNSNVPAYKSQTTKSKEVRFETMSIHFESERVLVYEGGPGIFPTSDDEGENFYDQWIDFNEGRHDDRLDAVEKMLEAAMISSIPPDTKSDSIREALSNASLI